MLQKMPYVCPEIFLTELWPDLLVLAVIQLGAHAASLEKKITRMVHSGSPQMINWHVLVPIAWTYQFPLELMEV